MPSIGRMCLLAQLLMVVGIYDVDAAFVPISRNSIGIRRSFAPRSFSAAHRLFYKGSSNRSSDTATEGLKNKTRRKRPKGPTNKNSQNKITKKLQNKKSSRPASFAAIKKEMQKDTRVNEDDKEGDEDSTSKSQNVINSATISRISRKRHQERNQEHQARQLEKEERNELKQKAFQLADEAERGFRSTPEQAKEMRAIIDRLTKLNPTTEPAWSYYGKKNPLTRQLYQSLANQKDKKEKEDINPDVASLEGKWILTYTDVPSVVDLANDSNRWGVAKLGRIGQECTPFPDYTVRTIIEWKRPDWVQSMDNTLPGPVSNWLFGKSESSILQKTTLRARATPDDPTSWGVSSIPRVFEVVSSRSSTALYDDDDEISSSLSFVTDDGLVALDPLKPLKIGLQIAGMNDEQGLFQSDENGKKGGTSLVTKQGLIALNPFQPWTVGLQMAGFGGKKANEPWNVADEEDHNKNNNLFEDINERGLVEGVLKQIPFQLPTPDAVASLLEHDYDEDAKDLEQALGKQRILYLDEDIRIIGDGKNHFTIESRACTDKDEHCWF